MTRRDPPAWEDPSRRLPLCAVLLAGGRGTRFWPRSRARTPKQLLPIIGKQTMLRRTVDRLLPVFGQRNFWAITNAEQAEAVRAEMPRGARAQVLVEPVGRNTAAAIALAAFHLQRRHGDALMAVLPSDSHIKEAVRYRALVSQALEIARAPGHLVVMGIRPAHAETGYGYIQRAAHAVHFPRGARAYPVLRFTEKPGVLTASEYLRSGDYYWNAGMFFWRVSAFLEQLERFLPRTYGALAKVAQAIGTSRYASALRRAYARLEKISVDYAVMERVTRSPGAARVFVVPADVGWSDIGSWAALYELLASAPGANVSAGQHFAVHAEGNFLWSPKKFVAAVGVRNLVLIETPDAILLCSRDRSQEVGKVVEWLESRGVKHLL